MDIRVGNANLQSQGSTNLDKHVNVVARMACPGLNHNARHARRLRF